MIKSMTGFGKSEITLPTKKISVEVRSLNSKQLDLSVKLPGIYRPFEFDIRRDCNEKNRKLHTKLRTSWIANIFMIGLKTFSGLYHMRAIETPIHR